jgi:AraC-like DNA-binding protein
MEELLFEEQKKCGSLLSVKDVAKLLNISPRTVYDYSRELGGFYPCGIKVLRFNPEDLYDKLERSQARPLALSIPVYGGEPLREGIQYGAGIRRRRSRAQKTAERENEAADRYGLFSLSRSVS